MLGAIKTTLRTKTFARPRQPIELSGKTSIHVGTIVSWRVIRCPQNSPFLCKRPAAPQPNPRGGRRGISNISPKYGARARRGGRLPRLVTLCHV